METKNLLILAVLVLTTPSLACADDVRGFLYLYLIVIFGTVLFFSIVLLLSKIVIGAIFIYLRGLNKNVLLSVVIAHFASTLSVVLLYIAALYFGVYSYENPYLFFYRIAPVIIIAIEFAVIYTLSRNVLTAKHAILFTLLLNFMPVLLIADSLIESPQYNFYMAVNQPILACRQEPVEDQYRCYYNYCFAQRTCSKISTYFTDPQICEKARVKETDSYYDVKDYKKNECYRLLAAATNNYTMCEAVKDEFQVSSCKEEVRVNLKAQ